MPNVLLEKRGEIAPERMKKLSQSENNTQLWMRLVVKQIRCYREEYCIGTWNVKFMNQHKLEVVKQQIAMAPHSSTHAWKIPWTEEPGGLQSMGSRRVGHDLETSLFTFMHWRRQWQPTPVFLPGECQGQRSLVGCHLWGHTELATTEAT